MSQHLNNVYHVDQRDSEHTLVTFSPEMHLRSQLACLLARQLVNRDVNEATIIITPISTGTGNQISKRKKKSQKQRSRPIRKKLTQRQRKFKWIIIKCVDNIRFNSFWYFNNFILNVIILLLPDRMAYWMVDVVIRRQFWNNLFLPGRLFLFKSKSIILLQL